MPITHNDPTAAIYRHRRALADELDFVALADLTDPHECRHSAREVTAKAKALADAIALVRDWLDDDKQLPIPGGTEWGALLYDALVLVTDAAEQSEDMPREVIEP